MSASPPYLRVRRRGISVSIANEGHCPGHDRTGCSMWRLRFRRAEVGLVRDISVIGSKEDAMTEVRASLLELEGAATP